MAVLRSGPTTDVATVDPTAKALRVSTYRDLPAYSVFGATGTMAAGLVAGGNSLVLVMMPAPHAGTLFRAYITKVMLEYTTIVAYTAPVTTGRRLIIRRRAVSGVSSVVPAGGTNNLVMPKRDTLAEKDPSMFDSRAGGILNTATTATITVNNLTQLLDIFATMHLTHVGAAGGRIEETFDFPHPIVLRAGEALTVEPGVTFDAVGTWQLNMTIEWNEGVLRDRVAAY